MEQKFLPVTPKIAKTYLHFFFRVTQFYDSHNLDEQKL